MLFSNVDAWLQESTRNRKKGGGARERVCAVRVCAVRVDVAFLFALFSHVSMHIYYSDYRA